MAITASPTSHYVAILRQHPRRHGRQPVQGVSACTSALNPTKSDSRFVDLVLFTIYTGQRITRVDNQGGMLSNELPIID